MRAHIQDINKEQIKKELNDKYPKIDKVIKKYFKSQNNIDKLIDLLPEDLKKEPTLCKDFNKSVILFGIPQCDYNKSLKFETIFKLKILKKCGIEENNIKHFEMYYDENKNTVGTLIMEFDTEKIANLAIKSLDNLKLDKKNTFSCFSFDKLDSLIKEEKIQELNLKNQEDLQQWIFDEYNRSQFVYIDDSKNLVINWFNQINQKFEVNKIIPIKFNGIPQINSIVISPSSSYIAIVNSNKINIYGGNDCELITSLNHFLVKKIKFSNNENYLISYNGNFNETKSNDNIILWNFLTSKKIVSFKIENNTIDDYRFSFDDKYFSCLNELNDEKFLYVYNLKTFEKIKCPITGNDDCNWGIKNCKNVYWSDFSDRLIIENFDSKKNSSNMVIYDIKEDGFIKINWKPINYEIIDLKIFWISENELILLKEILDGKKKEFILQNVKINKNKFNIEALKINLNFKSILSYSIGFDSKFFLITGVQEIENKEYKSSYLFNIENTKIDTIESYEKLTFDKCVFSPNSELFVLYNVNGVINISFIDIVTNKKGVKKNIVNIFNGKIDDLKNSEIRFDDLGRYFIVLDKGGSSIYTMDFLLNKMDKINNVSLNTVNLKLRNPLLMKKLKNEIQIPKIDKKFIENCKKENKKLLNLEEYNEDEKRELKKKNLLEYMKKKNDEWINNSEERKKRILFDEDDDFYFETQVIIDKTEKILEKIEPIEIEE